MRQTIYNLLLLLAIGLFCIPLDHGLIAQPGDITPSEINAKRHPKFINPLPIPNEIDVTKMGTLNMTMKETTQWLGLIKRGQPINTTVWGYGQLGKGSVTYPGPTLLAEKDNSINIFWRNQLPKNHLLPVDMSLHMARPRSGIPVVTHLHGGHTESASDGLPEAWYTQNYREKGPHFVKQKYRYDNDQEAATLWYHDHALGYTRLNVYAGLAGFYLLTDDNEQNLVKRNILPDEPYDIEIVIQDRSFDRNGQLMIPTEVESEGDCITSDNGSGDPIISEDPQPVPTTSAVAEFFGDFILVNGKTWPYLDVEPRKYRFRFLNGSDSRFYALTLNDAVSVMQIGSDDGLLHKPIRHLMRGNNRLVIAPGERYDLVMDFSGLSGKTITMLNWGPDEPFKGANYEYPSGRSTGRIMQFSVNQPLDRSVPNASVNTSTILRNRIAKLRTRKPARKLALFEGRDQYCRLRPQLGTVAEGSLMWDEPITENPSKNSVEIWEFYNATEDAHPVHIHLVKFQVIGRGTFNGTVTFDEDGDDISGGSKQYLSINNKTGPYPQPINRKGWKDTEIVNPGEYIQVIARYDKPGRYVWHCHILSHEDHEMMRPFVVGSMGGYTKSIDKEVNLANTTSIRLDQNQPNPFEAVTEILFELDSEKHVTLDVFNINGQLVKRMADQTFPAGKHTIMWDGYGDSGLMLPSGIYFYQLRSGGLVKTKRLSLQR